MNSMPHEPYWNSNGLMNNGVHKVLLKAIQYEDPLDNLSKDDSKIASDAFQE